MISRTGEPTGRQLRQFAAVALLFGAGLAAWITLSGGSRVAAGVLLGLGLAIGVAGLLRPPSVRLPFLLLMAATVPIAFVLSHLVLGILYYGVVTPTGLLLRLLGRDPLRLRDASASAAPDASSSESSESYWEPRERERDPARYLRQA